MKKKPPNRKVIPAVTIRRPIVLVATALLAALALLVSTAGTLTAKTVVATTSYSQHPFIQDYQGAGLNSENLSSNISGMDYVYSLAWNGSYWLIGGGDYGSTKTLVKYDGGSTYTDLTANISGMDYVDSLAWNGSYWLIGGSSTSGSTKTLIKYDGGSTYTDLTSNISGMDYVLSLAWNGSYWLIGGGGHGVHGSKTLIKYDGGSTYTDLTSKISGMDVDSLAWNGSYWLIGGWGGSTKTLVKYDGGSTYTDLTSKISGMDYGVDSLAWNGSYWLIGGSGIQTLVKYNGGSTYTDLTSNISEWNRVDSLAWNGSYWLIGGGKEGGSSTKTLVKYDGGSTYTNLTSKISGMNGIWYLAWNGSYWLIGGAVSETLYKLTETPAPTSRTWGHDSIGVTTPAQNWYLAEGCTNGGFETWVLVQNPNDSAADVSLTYMTPSGPVTGPSANLPPNSRKSFNVGDIVSGQWEVSTKVSSKKPVIAERAMYGPGRAWGTDSIGASETSKTWYLAEGCTSGGFETWVLVQNPNNTPAEVSLTYMTPGGSKPGPKETLPPNSRKSFSVAGTVPNTSEVSTLVSSKQPVIAERAVYWNNRKGGHESIGVTAPATTWYLAEGCTSGGFETWILVQNPGNTTASVDLTYMTEKGKVKGPHLDLPAHSRKTVNVAKTMPNNPSVSTKVTSKQPVIVERAVYWNNRIEGHDSIATTQPAKTWYLSEGSTGQGFETWVIVQNPNDFPAKVTLTYMTPSGPVKGPSQTIKANSRKTFNVANTVKGVYEVSTKVTSNLPVIAERAMYGEVADNQGHDDCVHTGLPVLVNVHGFEGWGQDPGYDYYQVLDSKNYRGAYLEWTDGNARYCLRGPADDQTINLTRLIQVANSMY